MGKIGDTTWESLLGADKQCIKVCECDRILLPYAQKMLCRCNWDQYRYYGKQYGFPLTFLV